MAAHEALKRGRVTLVPADEAAPTRVSPPTDAPARGVSLLSASVTARLGAVAGAVCLLWLAVYWALS